MSGWGLSTVDLIAYARLMNGSCPKCGTIKAHDRTPRCKCVPLPAAPPVRAEHEQAGT